MTAEILHFDRRAIHRILSEPVCLDYINDADALAQEAVSYLEAAHWLALGTGDAALVRGIAVAHSKLMELRRLAHEATVLIDVSRVVDPYLAVQFGSPRAA